MRAALATFGEEAHYGLRLVELLPAPSTNGRLALGRLIAPGHIVLYDQSLPPWRLGQPLGRREREQVVAAGANVDEVGVVHWPAGALRRFMLNVLAHEVGHHMLQHERRLRGERAARTREHESRADAIAARLKALLE